MLLLLLVLVMLTGCASVRLAPYTETCDITQPDKTGTGYTVGQFPCHLKHYEGKVQP